MVPMVLGLGSMGCEPAAPEAFDYHIDRTLVPGLRIVPLSAPSGTPRTIDALVLSPSEVRSVSVEVCGLRTDMAVELWGPECFAEPALVQSLGDALPLAWMPPDIGFDCERPDYGYYDYEYGYESGGSGLYMPYYCNVSVPVRVVAHTAEDEGASFLITGLNSNTYGDEDPALAEPLLEIQSGTAKAGGSITLRFTLARDWYGSSGELYASYRWWVDAGELAGTGRTGTTGLDEGNRLYSDNTLTIPADYHGPLRVAVVTTDGSLPAVWATRTLEVE